MKTQFNFMQQADLLASPGLMNQRLAQCRQCPNYRNKVWGIIPCRRLARCAACGCLLKLKTQFKATTCPIGNW